MQSTTLTMSNIFSQTSNSKVFSTLLETLPKKSMGAYELYEWEGFWYLPPHLEGILAAQSNFEACEDDIILASSVKTGTTWLKAIIPSIMHYKDVVADDDDPLIKNHPNVLIPSLEFQVYNKGNESVDFLKATSPRLFRTHAPYAVLPESIKKSGCKIVYITRNPKDTLVSLWHFKNSIQEGSLSIGETFESFCEGVTPFGSYFNHVLRYWKESKKLPEKILFIKYEDMKKDPRGEVKKIALFLRRPFENDEDVDKVLWRCSLERLKTLEVNKKGPEPWHGFPKSCFFRKGIVGDWKTTLTPEMVQRIDEISQQKLEGSGLKLDDHL